MATADNEIELILRIDLNVDPVTGSLTTPGGACHAFRGWIGLSAALERIRAASPDEPQRATDG